MRQTPVSYTHLDVYKRQVPDKEDVVPRLREMISAGSTVTCGGSVSLYQCGVIDFLRDGPYCFLDRDREGLSKEDREEIFRQAFSSDVYLCSSNAVTENGELYNVDGNSNRTAAILYGPKSVIMVVGINKIVRNLDEAVLRVKTCLLYTSLPWAVLSSVSRRCSFWMSLCPTWMQNSVRR